MCKGGEMEDGLVGMEIDFATIHESDTSTVPPG